MLNVKGTFVSILLSKRMNHIKKKFSDTSLNVLHCAQASLNAPHFTLMQKRKTVNWAKRMESKLLHPQLRQILLLFT
jgi:hypothetical protein